MQTLYDLINYQPVSTHCPALHNNPYNTVGP